MNFLMLHSYVLINLPMLDDELSSFNMDEIRQVFNAATGLSVSPDSRVSESSAIFLSALKDAEARGTLILEVLPKALREAKRIKEAKQ